MAETSTDGGITPFKNPAKSDCETCSGSGWILDPNPEHRCWMPCECTLDPPLDRMKSILIRFRDEVDQENSERYQAALDALT